MTKHVAILTAALSESEYLSQWLNLKDAGKYLGVEVSLFKNGLFQLPLNNSKSICYTHNPFDHRYYSTFYNGIGTSAKHGGNFYIAEFLEYQGADIFNTPSSIELTRNKLRTLNLLSKENIPITPTLVLRQPEDLLEVENYGFTFPLIVKGIFGSQGKSVMMVNDFFQLRAFFDFIWNRDRNEILLIQQFVSPEKERHEDIRVITLGKKVIASMIRYSSKGDFRTNFSLNRMVTSVELTQEEISYCEKTAEIFSLDYAGIDFIRTKNGPVFLEVNGTPGFTGINEVFSKLYNKSFFNRFIEFMISKNL